MSDAYLLERAWVDGAVRDDVLVEVEDGRFTASTSGADRRRSARRRLPRLPVPRLPGLTLPGLANCHSHAFHRALRGRTQRERGTFWTWREQMYAVAARLDPDTYFALARATYREMAARRDHRVGEFHYLHHQPDGTPYDDPNAMGARARSRRPARPGIRITPARHLLPRLRLRGAAARASQRALQRRRRGRAGRPSRACAAATAPSSAPRSTPSAPCRATQLPRSCRAARAPLHVHLSEQVAENDACLAAYGVTPTQLLADAGALGPRTSAVHATHLTDDDIALLGDDAAPTPASARPPSATSATASARPAAARGRAAG